MQMWGSRAHSMVARHMGQHVKSHHRLQDSEVLGGFQMLSLSLASDSRPFDVLGASTFGLEVLHLLPRERA